MPSTSNRRHCIPRRSSRRFEDAPPHQRFRTRTCDPARAAQVSKQCSGMKNPRARCDGQRVCPPQPRDCPSHRTYPNAVSASMATRRQLPADVAHNRKDQAKMANIRVAATSGRFVVKYQRSRAKQQAVEPAGPPAAALCLINRKQAAYSSTQTNSQHGREPHCTRLHVLTNHSQRPHVVHSPQHSKATAHTTEKQQQEPSPTPNIHQQTQANAHYQPTTPKGDPKTAPPPRSATPRSHRCIHSTSKHTETRHQRQASAQPTKNKRHHFANGQQPHRIS